MHPSIAVRSGTIPDINSIIGDPLVMLRGLGDVVLEGPGSKPRDIADRDEIGTGASGRRREAISPSVSGDTRSRRI
jgi:hypothetical protein